MDHGPINVFTSFSPSDLYRVEPWLVAMMAGGASVGWEEDDEGRAMQDLNSSRVVVAFVSGEAADSGVASRDVAAARGNSKPVIVVLLDNTDVGECRNLGCEVVDVPFVGRRKAWEQLIAELHKNGVSWSDPDQRPWWCRRRINEKRSVMRARRWAIAAGVAWIGVLVAYFGFLRPVEKEAPKAQPLPAISAAAPEKPASNEPETKPAAPPSAPTAPISTPPELPPAAPVDAMDATALHHVRACVEAGNREQRMADEQIENIVRTYFATQARIQDTGMRDFNGIKAYLTVGQLAFPRWKETIDKIEVTQRPTNDVRVVRVESTGQGYNPTAISATSQALVTEYTVQMLNGKPLIIAVHGEAVRSK
jgi:hypothetical protein